MPNKPRQQSETASKRWERLDQVIRQRFTASHMSDAKWVKLLKVAATLADTVPCMNYKLVDDDTIHRLHTPLHPDAVDPRWFKEPLIYKEVEWVEFPFVCKAQRSNGLAPIVKAQDIDALKRALQALGNFPLQDTQAGLRVMAYVRP
jgi:hypothetical protein